MESKIMSVKAHYEANLKPVAYCKEFTKVLRENRNLFVFIIHSVNDVIKSGRFSGTKLLEIASGATVHNVAIPSRQFTNIVQSDLVPDNYLELRKWHKGESTLDWSPFLEIAAEIDGYSDLQKGVLELESRIRNSVKSVVRGDVLSYPVLALDELNTPETQPPYDVIITALALAASAVDHESYVDIIHRLHGLLKQGGGLILVDFENGAPWMVGSDQFNHIQVSIQQVTEALELVGFGNLEFKVMAKDETDYDYKYDSLFCVAAEKL